MNFVTSLKPVPGIHRKNSLDLHLYVSRKIAALAESTARKKRVARELEALRQSMERERAYMERISDDTKVVYDGVSFLQEKMNSLEGEIRHQGQIGAVALFWLVLLLSGFLLLFTNLPADMASLLVHLSLMALCAGGIGLCTSFFTDADRKIAESQESLQALDLRLKESMWHIYLLEPEKMKKACRIRYMVEQEEDLKREWRALEFDVSIGTLSLPAA